LIANEKRGLLFTRRHPDGREIAVPQGGRRALGGNDRWAADEGKPRRREAPALDGRIAVEHAGEKRFLAAPSRVGAFGHFTIVGGLAPTSNYVWRKIRGKFRSPPSVPNRAAGPRHFGVGGRRSLGCAAGVRSPARTRAEIARSFRFSR